MNTFTLQAIVTKYHGPTNTRGARVSARATAGRVSYSWDCSLNAEDNHHKAARLFADKLGWLDGWALVGGGMPEGNGNVYVLVKVGTVIEAVAS